MEPRFNSIFGHHKIGCNRGCYAVILTVIYEIPRKMVPAKVTVKSGFAVILQAVKSGFHCNTICGAVGSIIVHG